MKQRGFSSIRTYADSLKYLQEVIIAGKLLPNPFDLNSTDRDIDNYCDRLQLMVDFIKAVPKVTDKDYTAVAYDLEYEVNEGWYCSRLTISIYHLSPFSTSPLRFVSGTRAYQNRLEYNHIKRVMAKLRKITDQLPSNWKAGIPFDQDLSPVEKSIGLEVI